MLADPRSSALVDEFRRPVAAAAKRPQRPAQLRRVPGLRRQPAPGVPPRDRTALREHHSRRPQRPRSAARRLHVRERAAGASLRHPRHLRQPLPSRAGDRRGAQGAARPGQHARGDLARRAHVAGAARQMGAREHRWACRCRRRRPTCRTLKPAEEGQKPKTLREQMAEHRTNPTCATLPQGDGSGGLRARELRRGRRVADAGSRRPDRRVGTAGRRPPR